MLGGLSGATSFYINISFPSFKNFLTFSFSRTRRTRIQFRIPLFRSLLIFTPRQQGWLASTISHTFACKTHEIYKILLFTLLFRLARAHGARGLVQIFLFLFLLIFTPRQQGWLASTISHYLVCKTHEIYKFWVANGTDVLVVQPGYLSQIANRYQIFNKVKLFYDFNNVSKN